MTNVIRKSVVAPRLSNGFGKSSASAQNANPTAVGSQRHGVTLELLYFLEVRLVKRAFNLLLIVLNVVGTTREYDDVAPIADELRESSVVRFCLENEFAGAARTVDRFRLLGNYSIVLISTHGNRHFQNFRHLNWDPGSSQPEYSDWRPAIWTWELLTETNAKRYAYDLQTG